MPLFYLKTVTYVYSLLVTYLTTLYTVLVRTSRSDVFSAGKSKKRRIFALQKCVLRTRGQAMLVPTVLLLRKADNQK